MEVFMTIKQAICAAILSITAYSATQAVDKEPKILTSDTMVTENLTCGRVLFGSWIFWPMEAAWAYYIWPRKDIAEEREKFLSTRVFKMIRTRDGKPKFVDNGIAKDYRIHYNESNGLMLYEHLEKGTVVSCSCGIIINTDNLQHCALLDKAQEQGRIFQEKYPHL